MAGQNNFEKRGKSSQFWKSINFGRGNETVQEKTKDFRKQETKSIKKRHSRYYHFKHQQLLNKMEERQNEKEENKREEFEDDKTNFGLLLKREIKLVDLIDQFLENLKNKFKKKAGKILKISDDESYLKGMDDIKIGRINLKQFLLWSFKRYKKDLKRDKSGKTIFKHVIGEEVNDLKNNFDNLKTHNLQNDVTTLPDVRSQSFMFKPYSDAVPKECFEVFYTKSMFLGTANVLGMNGPGTYIMPNGAIYVGNFKDNMFHGRGCLTYPNKTSIEGFWYKGKLMEPKVRFEDGLKYDPKNWSYLAFPDRRYESEKKRGLLPDNNPQLTNDHPPRALPRKCYDTGEGFYSIETGKLYHPITGAFLRVPSKTEEEWIINNCRSEHDPNVPFTTSMFPAQYDTITEPPELGVDRDWYYTHFPKIPSEIKQRIRNEFIQDLEENVGLSYATLLQLCVPQLKQDTERKVDWTSVPYHRYITSEYLQNLPKPIVNMLFGKETSSDEKERRQSQNSRLTFSYFRKERISKFIKMLQIINEFINGQDMEWSENLENDIKDCLKLLRALDEGFTSGILDIEKIVGKEYVSKGAVIPALVYWLGKKGENQEFPDQYSIFRKRYVQYEKFQKKRKEFKKKKATTVNKYNIGNDKDKSCIASSDGSIFELLKISDQKENISRKTRIKMARKSHLITADTNKFN